jgi:hypothetical protein
MNASLYGLTVSTNAGSTRATTGPIGVTAGPISNLPFRPYRYHLGASGPASTYLSGAPMEALQAPTPTPETVTDPPGQLGQRLFYQTRLSSTGLAASTKDGNP